MPDRPDPDKLLAKLEAKTERGKLTLFLGAAAGVGKTYAMLKALNELLADHVDVICGYIEPHAREETKSLIPANAEFIPLRSINYKGHQLHELDLEAILTRKPQLVIIDELAHTNVPGSRNSKRYQDVLEILAAGIDVYSALNIQHIESLNNVVEQITGVEVKETVPDYVIESATEVKLIDITPDELIERLREGKIYPPERIAYALSNFFRKGNLTALREMALLKTARKVEQQVKEYRTDHDIDNVWSSHDNLMVLIELGYSSEKIIRSGKNMFDKGFSQWFVVYITNSNLSEKPLREREKLLELLDLARELGAEVCELDGTNPSEALVTFAQENNINTIMLSQYRLGLYYRLFGTSLASKISELAPEINIQLVHDELIQKNNQLPVNHQRPRLNYRKASIKFALNLLLFSVLGLVLFPLRNTLANETIIMLYLLVVILTNHSRGRLSAIFSAILATISFDFFFVPPVLSFAISDLQYIIIFIVMAAVGTTFNIINGSLRYQLSVLQKNQKLLRLSYECSRKLAEALVEQQVIDNVQQYFYQIFTAKYALLIPSTDEELTLIKNQLDDQLDLSIAKWVFTNGQDAGLNTDTFASNKIYYMPINSQIRTRGVLAILPTNSVEFFLPRQQELLTNFVSNLAISFERIHFTQIAIQTEVLLATHKNQA